MKVLTCGSRTWDDREKIRAVLEGLPFHCIVIHGAHWEGADKIADEEAKSLGLRVIPFPAYWEKEGGAAGPRRNTRMLREGRPEMVFAFRSPGRSSGTDDTVKKARSLRIPTFVVYEDSDPPAVPHVQQALFDL